MQTKNIIISMFMAIMPGTQMSASQADTLTLDLQSCIAMAQEQSPDVKSARNTYLSAYWSYRNYQANYLPSVSLTSSPYVNRSINKITQSDGTGKFLKQDQFGADLTLKINQNIAFTGGSLFVKSSLNRLDEFQTSTTSYSSDPLVVGYQQTLFGYNYLKWDRRIEPVRYREAKKQYNEALELVSVRACGYFFSLASAQSALEMAQRNYASADTLYRMGQGRYDIGTITENEMLQLEINRLNQETSVMDARIYLEEQTQSFRSFLGLEHNTEIRVIIPDGVPQFDVPLQQALQLALENSPDPEYYNLRRLESKSNLARAKANAGLKADIYFQLGLSQTGRDVKSVYRSPDNQQYASISLSLPILDWGRGKGSVKVAKSQLELTNTQTDQGMRDFSQNVQKIVMQFNMQARKVNIASLTDKRAEHRHNIAQKLYVMGRNSILDLNSAIEEKNSAHNSYISAVHTYWSLYYTIRSMTQYDFERNAPL